jgi:hypothetical protein
VSLDNDAGAAEHLHFSGDIDVPIGLRAGDPLGVPKILFSEATPEHGTLRLPLIDTLRPFQANIQVLSQTLFLVFTS